ncbi:hypothetical protein BD779DRAFT_498381 [Infundibulicybe gibba]|nr:hypothetical protein BD779DRAFT_498381 [Infundibulicybe gibba]
MLMLYSRATAPPLSALMLLLQNPNRNPLLYSPMVLMKSMVQHIPLTTARTQSRSSIDILLIACVLLLTRRRPFGLGARLDLRYRDILPSTTSLFVYSARSKQTSRRVGKHAMRHLVNDISRISRDLHNTHSEVFGYELAAHRLFRPLPG